MMPVVRKANRLATLYCANCQRRQSGRGEETESKSSHGSNSSVWIWLGLSNQCGAFGTTHRNTIVTGWNVYRLGRPSPSVLVEPKMIAKTSGFACAPIIRSVCFIVFRRYNSKWQYIFKIDLDHRGQIDANQVRPGCDRKQ